MKDKLKTMKSFEGKLIFKLKETKASFVVFNFRSNIINQFLNNFPTIFHTINDFVFRQLKHCDEIQTQSLL
jgi:hypothetical protein